jgi:glutathionyl-hydroquinone reductase
VCIRQRYRVQYREPVQLNLFVPYEYGYDFKVIAPNKSLSARKILNYHNGRGAQEGLFAELKSQTQMDYVPARIRQAIGSSFSAPRWRTICTGKYKCGVLTNRQYDGEKGPA